MSDRRPELEIVPPPTSEERAAIEAALRSRAVLAGGRQPGAWWEAGVRESVDSGDPADSPVVSAAGLA